MQATADGEFYPEKSLDKNFRIPRQGMPGNINMSMKGDLRQNTNLIGTPLANSYYNYPYDPKAASSYYQFYPGYGGNMPGQVSGPRPRVPFRFNAPPPPPPPRYGMEPIKQNIFNTLRDFKEKPKVYDKNIYDGNTENNDDQGYGNRGYTYQGSNSRAPSNDPKEFGKQLFSRERYTPQENDYSHNNQEYDTNGSIHARNSQRDYNMPKRGETYGHNNNSGCNNRMGTSQSFGQIGKRENVDYGRGGNTQNFDRTGKRDFKNEKQNYGFKKDGFKRQQKKVLEKKPAYGFSVQQTVPDLLDESLPKELKLMFQPLFCKLCSAQLSSNQAAKMHYKSKNHEKKIRKWLVEWSEKTGEPLPKRALATNTKKDEGTEKNPAWFHCDVCDLELTGKLHAESHYMGKNHQKALLGYKNPSGQGFYKDGKWIRIKGQKSKSYDFEKGQDNFGMDFKKAQEDAKEADAEGGEPPAKKKKESAPPSKFRCEVCSVDTTCQDQLDSHYRGQKHMKKLKQLGLENYAEHGKNSESSGSTPVPVAASEPAVEVDMNLSVYRTPSGDYYCPTCNLTANSEPQFIQHMRSKGHAKKAAQKKIKTGN